MVVVSWLILLLYLSGLSAAGFWMEDMKHLGKSPYHPDPSYQVFRNVKDFGAAGDGVHDDTDAINQAISWGQRCEPGVCRGSTIAPAVVYFPPGTYLISNSIIDLFYTQLIGDPVNRPVIKASPSFPEYSFGLIDSNPYQPNSALAWNSTNAFFRQIRNLIIDTSALPPDFPAVGIHWPSSQATAITNCIFQLSTAPGNTHTGLFIEEGSGGLLNDLYFYGGGKAAIFGNQQYTARNLWFFNADVAIHIPWNWSWTFKSLYITDCRVGIQMDQDQKSTGSLTLLDSEFHNVDVGIITTRPILETNGTNGTLVMENVQFNAVNKAVQSPDGIALDSNNWRQGVNDLFIMGHLADENGIFGQTGYYASPSSRNPRLVNGIKYFERSKPHYSDIPAQGFYSARLFGATGDGSTDDTQALNALFNSASSNGTIAFLDAGVYVVTDTILIPPNTRVVGEALTAIIMASGSNFQDMANPRPVVQVGRSGDVGYIEWSDTFVSTRGPCAGAILIEYNLFTNGTPSGMWDVHTRIGGFAGTSLQVAECPAIKEDYSINSACIAAYMSMRVTESAGGLYSENCWFWVADHDLEDQQYSRITIYAGRGLLIESSRGQFWFSASGSEHHVLYQYQLSSTRDVYIGHMQTESAYYQPLPLARLPFPALQQINDPNFELSCQSDPTEANCEMGWGLRIMNSSNVAVYGAGIYSFFDMYSDKCAAKDSEYDCQTRIVEIAGSTDGIKLVGLSTVGTTVMITENSTDRIGARINNSTFADTLALYQPQ
ncbi:pectate lyase superfamily protein-domain-containing protein [Stachybotrys elegans]|uniref:Pectate lyase superfamily protein-domain-containing protein n=1 Tax=Stachybotrys elegans TaxID=80388 RepID=A0A8K0ST65_9HYPO|nr:pectate lyase superfamily protein-domain-containing protein [Stachybotrys elegans]